MNGVLALPPPFAEDQGLVHELVDSKVRWLAAKSPDEVREIRETIVTRVELEARELVESGAAATWLQEADAEIRSCLLYTSPSPRDRTRSRMPSSA